MSATFSRQSVPASPRRSYTAVGSFGLAFFRYDYGMNPQTLVEQGSLVAYGTSADCPAGRVLYENGRKIVPPQGNFPPIMISGAIGNNPLTSYMVGVFDPQSGLNGFIDPNSVNFAINSTDKPVFLNGSEGTGPSTNIPNSGNPVVTNGNILSLMRPFNESSVPLPQYVGIATKGVDYLNFMNEGNNLGIFEGPYSLLINQGVGEGPNDINVGMACGEGGDLDTSNWAGMYSSGNVYYSGSLNARSGKSAGVSNNMVAGSVVVDFNDSNNDNNYIVMLTHNTPSYANTGVGQNVTPGVLTYTQSGTSRFIINSTNGNETSRINYFIVRLFDQLA